MSSIFYGIIGWFGAVWWPGIEVDAPKPGGGDPWWMRAIVGIAGGVIGQLAENFALGDASSILTSSFAAFAGGNIARHAMGGIRQG